MIAALRATYDRFVGRGEAAVTVPPMDGALRPNQALENAPEILAVPAPDNLVAAGEGVLFSSGATLRRLGEEVPVAAFDSAVCCLAAGPRGELAIGLEDGRVLIRQDGETRRTMDSVGGTRLVCPTALLWTEQALVVAQGSARLPPHEWKRDLMERGASGSVWKLPHDGGAPLCLAEGLAFPHGLLADGDSLIVSESWRHRLLRLDGRRAPSVVLGNLPGYPARLCRARDGGAWLAVFAPRSQLVEFVLREPGYRTRMMEEVPSEYWVAPALYSGRSFLEPLQGGGVKQMGILKPWAPARSYGLVIRLDAGFAPTASLHSRADGRHHGVTSLLEHAGTLLVASKGGDAILAVDAGEYGRAAT